MKWSEPEPRAQQGKRKPVMVQTARVKGQPDRFLLYQTNAGMIPSMWTLIDDATGTQHYLYANGRPEAHDVASKRIAEILAK